MPLNQGDVFAGYTIVRRLGSGGMGEVYLARHPRLPRRDALKVLPATLTADQEYRQRLSREADIAAELWHPHIVGIHDRGEFEGQLWLSMDYVEGTDAAELLRTRYPSGMPKAEVFEIITAVAGALFAYYRGFVSVEAFSLFLTIQYVAMVIVGGMGSLLGALLGAAFVTIFPYVIESALLALPGAQGFASLLFAVNYAAFGLVMILFLLLEPLGLVGIWRRIQSYFLLWPYRHRPAAGAHQ